MNKNLETVDYCLSLLLAIPHLKCVALHRHNQTLFYHTLKIQIHLGAPELFPDSFYLVLGITLSLSQAGGVKPVSKPCCLPTQAVLGWQLCLLHLQQLPWSCMLRHLTGATGSPLQEEAPAQSLSRLRQHC